jgi:hypothetical protein
MAAADSPSADARFITVRREYFIAFASAMSCAVRSFDISKLSFGASRDDVPARGWRRHDFERSAMLGGGASFALMVGQVW